MRGTPVLRSAAMVRRTARNAKRSNSRGASRPAQDSKSIRAWAPAAACARRYAAMQLIEGQSLAQVIEARRKEDGGRGREEDDKGTRHAASAAPSSALPLP